MVIVHKISHDKLVQFEYVMIHEFVCHIFFGSAMRTSCYIDQLIMLICHESEYASICFEIYHVYEIDSIIL